MDHFSGISISTRMTSGFPLSIGTALAFESVFEPIQKPYDQDRRIPVRLDPSKYDTCYVNLSTLYRNLVGSMEKNTFNLATVDDLLATLIEEIGVIQSLFASDGAGCVPKFYVAEHKTLTRGVKLGSYVNLKLREATTENQKYYHAQEETCIKLLNKYTDSIVQFPDAVTPTGHERAFILTHRPYDLIEHGKFSQLDLLESNTGVLKTRYEWASKYHPFGEKDLSHLPFNKKLLFIFGDKAEIKPTLSSIRAQVYDLSVQRNWTPTTTMDKINLTLQIGILDPAVAAMLRSYG